MLHTGCYHSQIILEFISHTLALFPYDWCVYLMMASVPPPTHGMLCHKNQINWLHFSYLSSVSLWLIWIFDDVISAPPPMVCCVTKTKLIDFISHTVALFPYDWYEYLMMSSVAPTHGMLCHKNQINWLHFSYLSSVSLWLIWIFDDGISSLTAALFLSMSTVSVSFNLKLNDCSMFRLFVKCIENKPTFDNLQIYFSKTGTWSKSVA